MSQNPPPARLLDRTLFGALVTKYQTIWQMDFLSADKLATFAQKRGISFFAKDDIIRFWQFGLLQADLIESGHALQDPGLVEQEKGESGEYIYSDERTFIIPSDGWDDAEAKRAPLSRDVQLFFHPFRYYVLCQFADGFASRRVGMKVSFPFKRSAVPHFSWLENWSVSEDFIEKVIDWNDSASFLILTEPWMYEKVFRTFGLNMYWAGRGGWEGLYRQRDQLENQVTQCYQAAGVEQLKKIYWKLCGVAHDLDPNEEIHTLICLGESKNRLELEGHLGGAIYLRTMAELLRRAIEKIFAPLQLPEEDVGRFGAMPNAGNYKKGLYGSERLLDGDRFIANEFLKQLGLNFGFRLRWYAEGKTEWGAIHHYCQSFGITEIDIVDLHGEVAQKAQKGIAFRENLRADILMEVYSIVSVDADAPENARVVRKAAEDDEICGAFYIASPDFEFENFEHSELEEIIWKIAKENGAGEADRETLHNAVQGKNKGEIFINSAKRSLPEFLNFSTSKGTLWGERLMAFALEHPFKQARQRQMLAAIDLAIFWTRTSNLESYKSTRSKYQVDKDTGKLVQRAKQEG